MLRFNSDDRFNLPVGNVDFNNNVQKALLDYFQFTKDHLKMLKKGHLAYPLFVTCKVKFRLLFIKLYFRGLITYMIYLVSLEKMI